MRIIGLLAWAGAAMAAPAHAAVTGSSAIGFATESSVEIAADAADVYALLITPGRWWSDAHSYSGDSANMTIDPRAGGCFCETIPSKDGASGTIEHARILYAMPGQRLRFSGGFGPLQSEGVAGTLDIAITPAGKGVKVTMAYVVGGYLRAGPDKIAPLVDQVLGEQLVGLKRAAESAQ
ncbi:Uncharacterized conserved protein YndB, AHSA1/START domain [Sphingobium sp. AP50]|uniref:SRPBCC family protein n=1 Tax=Sphingobium sp. AP50 TaxID=1884369 RepID=UPI0008C4222D|nr:SRPBCC domain-containing protein [Sphingobium sp. AP50]SEI60831.1 Uncharacterized conserved protein YndB, AHSA1/START domain [Sphingobium sp. AP50]